MNFFPQRSHWKGLMPGGRRGKSVSGSGPVCSRLVSQNASVKLPKPSSGCTPAPRNLPSPPVCSEMREWQEQGQDQDGTQLPELCGVNLVTLAPVGSALVPVKRRRFFSCGLWGRTGVNEHVLLQVLNACESDAAGGTLEGSVGAVSAGPGRGADVQVVGVLNAF